MSAETRMGFYVFMTEFIQLLHTDGWTDKQAWRSKQAHFCNFLLRKHQKYLLKILLVANTEKYDNKKQYFTEKDQPVLALGLGKLDGLPERLTEVVAKPTSLFTEKLLTLYILNNEVKYKYSDFYVCF